MTQNLTFDQWFKLVDVEVQKICGVSVHEISDFPSWDTWDSGASPREGAEAALADDDLYCLVFGDEF